MASYKNSFSMTEWRIRLEGSGQSSGTPFKRRLLRSIRLLPLYLCPLCEGKKAGERWALFPLLLNVSRNYQEFSCCVKELIQFSFFGYCLISVCQMIPDPSKAKKHADTLINPGAEHITLNSFLLNFTCLNRTYLNNWMSFGAPNPQWMLVCHRLIFSSMNIPPGTRYESVGRFWGTPDFK